MGMQNFLTKIQSPIVQQNAGAACDNSKLIHVGDNSELYSDDNGTLFGSLGDNRGSEENFDSHRAVNAEGTAEFSKLSLIGKDFVSGDEKSKSPSDAFSVISVGGGKKIMSPLLLDDDRSENSRFSADSAARFSAKSAASSDENELTDFDVVATVKKKQENHSSSSSRTRNLPLRTSIRVLGKRCDSQVLNHDVFTMYIHQSFWNIRPNPNSMIENILSDRKINIIPANAKFNAMVDAWNASNKSVPSL